MDHHRVLLVVTVVEAAVVAGMPSEAVAGEENDRNNEHNAGDDGDPGRDLEDLGGLVRRRHQCVRRC